MRDFRKLEIWKRSFALVKEIYKYLDAFPKEENFGLKSQMKRASISIPSNIAEGCGRSTDRDLARFIDIALGSAFELETQVLLSLELGFGNKEDIEKIIDELTQIQKMTNRYLQSIR